MLPTGLFCQNRPFNLVKFDLFTIRPFDHLPSIFDLTTYTRLSFLKAVRKLGDQGHVKYEVAFLVPVERVGALLYTYISMASWGRSHWKESPIWFSVYSGYTEADDGCISGLSSLPHLLYGLNFPF